MSCGALELQGDRAREYFKSNDTTPAWLSMLVLSGSRSSSRDLDGLIRARWRDEVANSHVVSRVQGCQHLFVWSRHIYQDGERFRSLVPTLIQIAEANEHRDWLKAAKAISVLGLIGDRSAAAYLLHTAQRSQANAYLQKSAILALSALEGFSQSPVRNRLEELSKTTDYPEVRVFIKYVINEAQLEESSNPNRTWPPRSVLLRYGLQPPPYRSSEELNFRVGDDELYSHRSYWKGWDATWRGRRFHLAYAVSLRHELPADAVSALRAVFSCTPFDIGATTWSPERDFKWILAGCPEVGPGTIVYAWEPKTGSVRTVAVLHGTVLRARLFTNGWLLVGTDRRDIALHRSGRMEFAN